MLREFCDKWPLDTDSSLSDVQFMNVDCIEHWEMQFVIIYSQNSQEECPCCIGEIFQSEVGETLDGKHVFEVCRIEMII